MGANKDSSLIKRLTGWYFSKRVLPYWCIILLDATIVFLSCIFTFWLSQRTDATFQHRWPLVYTAALYALVSLIGSRIFKTYSGIVRYSSFVDLLKVAYANAVTLVLCAIISFSFKALGIEAFSALSLVELIVAMAVAVLFQWTMRIVVKLLFDVVNRDTQAIRVLIYGALSGGVALAKYIRSQNDTHFELMGFISHEQRIKNMRLLDLPVYMADDENMASILRRERIQGVVVTSLRAEEFRNNQKIQDILISAGCKIFMAKPANEEGIREGEIVGEQKGEDKIQLKEVSVEDLLPREQIRVDMKSVGDQLRGRRVLITGSAGSIGAEIVRQVAAFGPAEMMLIDQAETPQHDLRLMMASEFPDVKAHTVVTSISRRTRMEEVFSTFKPEYVFHAAAYKHVPMMEDNPSEAILNNVYGTKIIADLSVKYGARKFVMISTDKAVNPTNVMGASKRICEIYVQSLDRKLKMEAMQQFKEKGNVPYTQFVTTRFGNVLGSNGSVIPLFREQIKRGGPVTVTDERIVRYFMLIPEACKLVLEAGTKGNGGEIFVFDMGKPVHIADLAKRMIALSGAKNIEIKYTGLRDGEKLYEEVLGDKEGTKPTFHEKIRIATVREYDFDSVSKEIDELVEISKQFDDMATVRKMKQIVPEFVSNNSVYEALDSENGGGVVN